MKNVLLLLFLLPLFAWAQKIHTVGPKETLFSIGRQYNVHPRELAAFNNIPFETGLTIGQELKIPSKKTMAPLPATTPVATKAPEVKVTEKAVVQKVEQPMQGITMVPVYHTVQKKETLYQISRLYNKVPVADLKKWNKLESDGLSEGARIIVGYKKGQNETAVITETVKPEVKKEIPVIDPVTEPVKQEKVITEKVEVTPKATAPVPQVPAREIKPVDDKSNTGGFFKAQFNAQSAKKEETGTAAIFKSTSGWEDRKYYCLHNDATAGSIIKITNKNNQKVVYAKVLDVIPDLKQNTGILIRISNAAAEELGVTSDNFEVLLHY